MIVIVDYGMGNLHSVQKAGEFVGKRFKVTGLREVIKKAKKIVLPGVAHFGKTVKELKKRKLFDLLKEMIKDGIPFWGICVGMQLLLEESEEAKGVKGLGVIEGRVKLFRRKNLIVPHMGWNQVRIENRGSKFETQDLFKGIDNGSYFYFANSYYCVPQDKDVIAATTNYGREFVSAFHRDNIWAVQFHPEKSQESGLRLFRNFLYF